MLKTSLKTMSELWCRTEALGTSILGWVGFPPLMARQLIRDDEEVHVYGWRNGLVFQSAARRTSAEQNYAGICEAEGWLSRITHLRHSILNLPPNGPARPPRANSRRVLQLDRGRIHPVIGRSGARSANSSSRIYSVLPSKHPSAHGAKVSTTTLALRDIE